MPEETRTQYSQPIPLRGNESRPGEGESANPWSRLEAVTSTRERLGWLADHLQRDWDLVAGTDVCLVLEALAEELHAALWGDLAAVERVRHRVPRSQLEKTWSDALDPEGPL